MKLFEQLAQAGALASTEVVTRDIEIPGIGTYTVHVREIPDGEAQAIRLNEPGGGHRLVAAGIRNQDGTPFATVAQIESLKPRVVRALESVVMAVNFPNEKDREEVGKDSAGEGQNGSGTSSPDISDEPSES